MKQTIGKSSGRETEVGGVGVGGVCCFVLYIWSYA